MLRSVRWTSFQPNFFITFRPGVLDDAPKTYLASLPRADAHRREQWQASLFEGFSNISSIDVTRLMETLLEGFSQISMALRLMALLAGMAGMAAVFSVLRLRVGERRGELHLLKLLGAAPRSLTRALSLEAAVLGGAAGTLGVLLSLVVGAVLSMTVFESPPALPSLRLMVAVPLAFAIGGGLLGRLSTRDVLATRPQEWLRSIQDGG